MAINAAERLAAAKAAVLDAATVCRGVQSQLETLGTLLKGDKSPVTVADFAAQAVIAHRLGEALGPVQLVGEEDAAELREQVRVGDSALAEAVLVAVQLVWPEATLEAVLDAIDVGNAEPLRDELTAYWTLDPIDGTKGFLRGQQYAISLGFIESGEVVLGALGCPNLALDHGSPFDTANAAGSLYFGERGAGVRESACVRGAESERALERSAYDGAGVRVCASVEKAHSSVSDTDRVIEAIGEAGEPARLDSQAKYAVVARGQADAYLRLPTRKGYVERVWDHAAGSLIAEEAGAVVSDIAGNRLDFSKGKGLEANRGVVCAAAGLHHRLIAAIEELGIGAD